MKLPYVVSPNAIEAYQTAPAMRTSVAEVNRIIVADDFEWDEGKIPKQLQEWCGDTLAQVFHRIDPLPFVLPKDFDMLMDVYPDNIPLEFSVPLIPDGRYWQRSFCTKWPLMVQLKVKSWKQFFLATYLREYLEKSSADVFIEEDAVKLAALVSPFIFELILSELQVKRQPKPPHFDPEVIVDLCEFSVPRVYDHIPLENVLKQLENLQEINIQFGVKDLNGFGYQKRFFEFSVDDCISIGKGLEPLNNLKIFRVTRSNLDCKKTKIFLQYLLKKPTLEEIDFSHCKIGNLGMKALAGFLFMHENLRVLNVTNNCFGDEGMQGLAYCLTMKPPVPIEKIVLRLNTISIESARMLSSAFVRLRDKPQTLDLSGCGLNGDSAVNSTPDRPWSKGALNTNFITSLYYYGLPLLQERPDRESKHYLLSSPSM